MLQELRANSLETNGKTGVLSKEMEAIKKNQIEILEPKNNKYKKFPGGVQ